MSLRECLQHTIAALAIGCAAIGQAATAYVSTTGNDGEAVLDDADHPYGTVSGAVAALGEEGGTVPSPPERTRRQLLILAFRLPRQLRSSVQRGIPMM